MADVGLCAPRRAQACFDRRPPVPGGMYGVERKEGRLNGPVDGGTGGTGQMWMLGELFCVVLVGVGAEGGF